METPPVVVDEKARADKTITNAIYALYAASLFIGVTAPVAIVLNYIKKDFIYRIAKGWLNLNDNKPMYAAVK